MGAMRDAPISPLPCTNSSILRIIVGLFGILIYFIVTIQSSSVNQLLADFVELALASSIDDVMLILSCDCLFFAKKN